ncbi:hypothetical protein BaRGS_00020756 [Batillaria attramentaria]|uniref:Uncharacterized protein n=1 Tax=Batillaria attramentaria TaxID=370345 RepID=A0ABD0KLR3_9CAEN
MEAVWFHYVLLCAICENLRRKVFKNPGRNSGRVDSLQQMCCNSLVFGAARDVPVFSTPATIASDIDAQRQYFAMCEKAEEIEQFLVDNLFEPHVSEPVKTAMDILLKHGQFEIEDIPDHVPVDLTILTGRQKKHLNFLLYYQERVYRSLRRDFFRAIRMGDLC